MREFVLLALTSRTSPFDIKDLPKAGRMDLVTRFISNAFYTSKAIRKDTVVHACLNGPSNPPKTITFNGAKLRGMEPDEKNIGKLILKALNKGLKLKPGQEIDLENGVSVSMRSFESIIKERTKVAYMHWEGEDVRKAKIEGYTFVVGDYIGLPRITEKLLDRKGALRISLGPTELFASHCPVLIHNELDRREF